MGNVEVRKISRNLITSMGFFAQPESAVRVELARHTLRPGETVAGVVYLDLARSVPAACLTVRVVGEERVAWKRKGVAHSKVETRLDEESVLALAGTAFTVGETQYPFTFHLPQTTPPSFSFATEKVDDLVEVSVVIEYRVEAELEVRRSPEASIHGHSILTVEPIREVVKGNPISVHKACDIKFQGLYFFSKRGFCELDLDVHSDVFAPSSTIEATLAMQHGSPTIFKYLCLLLYEDTAVTSCEPDIKGVKNDSRVVAKLTISPERLRQFPTEGEKTLLTLSLPVSSDQNATDANMVPTIQTHFLGVSYRVVVECRFSMAQPVTIEAPISIVRDLNLAPATSDAPLGEKALAAIKNFTASLWR